MRDFNGNAEKSNAARTAYDLELELIDRDLEFNLGEAIRACGTEPSFDGVASLIRRAVREFDWHRRYAHRILRQAVER